EYFAVLQAKPAVDGSSKADVAHNVVIDKFAAMAKQPLRGVGNDVAHARRQFAVQALIAAYRMVGSRQADLDPLRWSPVAPLPELTPASHGLEQADLNAQIDTAGTYFSPAPSMQLKEMVAALQETYTGTLGAEYMYLADAEQRQWWQQRLESHRAKAALT